MSNRVALLIILVSLLLALGGYIASRAGMHPMAYQIFQAATVAAHFMMIVMVLANGTFYPSRLFWLTLIPLGIFGLGLWMNILHLPPANIVLAIGALFFPLPYTIHFFRKKKRKSLDLVKWLAVLIAGISYALHRLHLLPDASAFIPWMALWTVFLWFVITGINNRSLFQDQGTP